jgi:hypothetical protein
MSTRAASALDRVPRVARPVVHGPLLRPPHTGPWRTNWLVGGSKREAAQGEYKEADLNAQIWVWVLEAMCLQPFVPLGKSGRRGGGGGGGY